jgi:glycosyltransferase involved in cell wall biosynthesis
MRTKEYPKILILGDPFNKNSGGGITMSNLFHGWPKDKLALASSANLLSGLDYSICEKFFQLGYNGKLHPFPLGLILPKINCGPVILNKTSGESGSRNFAQPGKYKNIYGRLRTVLKFLGIYDYLYKLKITPEFREWLAEYNPDIIYSQLSTLELIRLVMDVHKMTDKSIALHIMDDWPVTIVKKGILHFYWKKAVDREFRQLLDHSSVLMSICDSMSEEYKIRYNKDFIPFHNPIETANWLPFTKKDWNIKEHFILLYAGRIGLGMKNTISDIADAVNDLSGIIDNIIFEIQTNDIAVLEEIIEFNDHVKWVKPINYTELPMKFSKADLLILPVDFDEKSIKFMKFSFPTKISEYMISGTPVLVYADESTSTAKYALKEKWAYTVTNKNKQDLIEAIRNLYSDVTLRKKLGERARDLAVKLEDSELVRDKFRGCLTID